MYLDEKTKKTLEESLGLPYEKLIELTPEEEIALVEKKIGKKLGYPKYARVDGLPIRTMEEVDKKIDAIGNPLKKTLFKRKVKILKK